MTDKSEQIDKIKFQIRLLAEAIDSQVYPIPSLVVELDWGQSEFTKAQDIFDDFDNAQRKGEELSWIQFEARFADELDIGYQLLKVVILAFYRANMWRGLCLEYAKANEVSEFRGILIETGFLINRESLVHFAKRVSPHLPPFRDEGQLELVLKHLKTLTELAYQNTDELNSVLEETRSVRRFLAEKFPPKSGLDELVRSLAILNEGYVPYAFPGHAEAFKERLVKARSQLAAGLPTSGQS